jgi:hypothetical protein
MRSITRGEFADNYRSIEEPILVQGGLWDWPAIRWSPETLGSLAFDRLIDLQVSLNGSFRMNPDLSPVDPKNQILLRDVKFGLAAQEIINNESLTTKYYITQQNIVSKLPELLPDLACWWPISDTTINIWFGSSGVITPLHFDHAPNLFAQIFGRKKFTLFGPDQSQYLYQYPAETKMSHVSYVDVERPDLLKHPNFTRAQQQVHVMHPGQMLFLPPRWWHHVEAMDISISVNQWWRTRDLQYQERTLRSL